MTLIILFAQTVHVITRQFNCHGIYGCYYEDPPVFECCGVYPFGLKNGVELCGAKSLGFCILVGSFYSPKRDRIVYDISVNLQFEGEMEGDYRLLMNIGGFSIDYYVEVGWTNVSEICEDSEHIVVSYLNDVQIGIAQPLDPWLTLNPIHVHMVHNASDGYVYVDGKYVPGALGESLSSDRRIETVLIANGCARVSNLTVTF